jgi:hypothetical protein
MKSTKPNRGKRKGFVTAQAGTVDTLQSTTRPLTIQLLGVFDRESKSAVILLPREARP